MKKRLALLLAFMMLLSIPVSAAEFILGIDSPYYSEDGVWSASGLKGYDNSATKYAYQAGNNVTWQVPFTTSKTCKVYYYTTYSPAQETDAFNADFVITFEGNKTSNVNVAGVKEIGWYELGTYTFNGVAGEGVTLKANGLPHARATNVKFVEVFEEEIQDITSPYYSETGSWLNSGLKGFNNSATKYVGNANSTCTWQAPFTSAKSANVYYYTTYSPSLTTDSMGCTVTVTYEGNKTQDVQIENLREIGWFDLGNYTFNGTPGEGVTIKSNGKGTTRATNVKYEYTNAAPQYIFDAGGAEYSETGTWMASGTVKGYGNTTTRYPTASNSAATWQTPFVNEKIADVYYYVSFLSTSETDTFGATITVTYDGDKTKTIQINNSREPGWYKLGNFNFTGAPGEGVTVKANGNGTCRATNVKYLENNKLYTYQLIRPEHIFDMGSWVPASMDGAFEKSLLYMPTNVNTQPAKMSVPLSNGHYYVHIHTCDYIDYATATRLIQLKLNGTDYRKSSGTANKDYFGTHQYDYQTNTGSPENNTPVWGWEKIGYPATTVAVTNNKLDIEVANAKNTSSGRFDAIIITDDPEYTPSNLYENIQEDCEVIGADYPYQDNMLFPAYAKAEITPVQTFTLQNANVKVDFRIGQSDGKNVVQRQTTIGTTVVNQFTDGLGWMSLYADTSLEQANATLPTFRTTYTNQQGGTLTSSTNNIYSSGIPSWMVADTLTQADDGSIVMTGANDYATFTAAWSLGENDKEPKVTISFIPKANGYYSFGMFNNVNEVSKDEIKYILTPYRYQEMRLPKRGYLVAESMVSTPMTQATYKPDTLAAGKDVTLGIAVDPSALEYRWVYNQQELVREATDTIPGLNINTQDEQSNYGLGITGPFDGVLPAVFAPMMSTYDSQRTANTAYTYAYRPIATISDVDKGWYDSYAHVVNDILGVTDYRDNYFESMTNTAFNMYNLLLDDYYSGWDENAKAHYNMEDSNWVTNSNPLAYLQFYLLTEDQTMLEKRTIPTMEYMLTRKSPHLHYDNSIRGESPGQIGLAAGEPNNGMGNSDYGGAFYMTRGQVPAFKQIASSKLINTFVSQGDAAGLKNPSEAVWYQKLTGDQSALVTSTADAYLTQRVNTPASTVVPDVNFINIDFFPHFQSLADAYEQTNNTDYLNGAIESARRLLPCIWAGPMPSLTDTVSYNQNEVMTLAKYRSGGATMFFHGATRLRLGIYEQQRDPSNPLSSYYPISFEPDAILQSEQTYPQWVTSRVGLGLEQTTTFQGGPQSNIYMSTWASDLLRLGKLANDETMQNFARNSIVGRYSNYPGYYINQFQTYQSDPNFPYKGPDTLNIYYHHIPVMLSAIQDYLFSNAWVLSDGAIDFPTTRSQGYAWFNNRQYGYDSGSVYAETNMWPWLKEGTITISASDAQNAKQIDWIGARKEGRAAFALTNASAQSQAITINLNTDLGVLDGSTVTIYDQAGSVTTSTVSNQQIALTVPAKDIVTIAIDGTGIHAPAIAKVQFSEAVYQTPSTDLGGSEVHAMMDGTIPSNQIYDISGYALAVDPDSYYGYVFVNKLPSQISSAQLEYKLTGDTEWTTLTDDAFPYEFTIPVTDVSKNIEFKVTTIAPSGTQTMTSSLTLNKKAVPLITAE